MGDAAAAPAANNAADSAAEQAQTAPQNTPEVVETTPETNSIETQPESTTEVIPTTPVNKQKYMDYIRKRLGDDVNFEDEESMYSAIMDYHDRSDNAQGKLVDAITADPRMAQLFSDVLSGKNTAAYSIGRYFGRDILNAEDDSPELQDLIRGEEERMQELQNSKQADETYNQNMTQSFDLIDQFAQANKIDADQFLDDVHNKILQPIFTGQWSEDLLKILSNGLSYEKDIQDAMQAGEVKAKNKRIEQMKKKDDDGLPRLRSTGSMKTEQPEKSRSFSARPSVWDTARNK